MERHVPADEVRQAACADPDALAVVAGGEEDGVVLAASAAHGGLLDRGVGCALLRHVLGGCVSIEHRGFPRLDSESAFRAVGEVEPDAVAAT